MDITSTGSYIALAGILASALAHWNIIIPENSLVAVIAGVVAAYGIIHQIIIHKMAAA